MTKGSTIDNPDSQVILNQVVLEYMREQKNKRIWRRIKRAIIVLLIILVVYLLILLRQEEATVRKQAHVGLINLKGTIFEDQTASSDNFMKGLSKAYKSDGLKALIIRINSPGGSPVQADYMYNSIRYYQKKYPNIKIYAVCVDMCASAAYYVAAAADQIYASPVSLVGSIGVVYNGFGFVDTLQKLGISRRLQTAGTNKGFMDPFSAEKPQQQKILQTMLDLIHQQFIQKVKEGRGKRLHINNETFSGLFWTGIQAKEMGLIDGLASSGQLVRDVIKIESTVDYTYQPSVVERVAKNIGTAMADQLPMSFGVKPGIQ